MLAPAEVVPTTTKKRLTGRNRLGIDTLTEALSKHGKLPPTDVTQNNTLTIGQTVVHVDEWRKLFYARVPVDGDQYAKKKAFQRVRGSLLQRGEISTWEEFIWHSLQK